MPIQRTTNRIHAPTLASSNKRAKNAKKTGEKTQSNLYLKPKTTCVVNSTPSPLLSKKPDVNSTGTELQPGTMGVVLERKGSWHQVKTRGKKGRKGWVHMTSNNELLAQPDVPRAERGAIGYGQFAGKPFASKKPKMADINQGYLGDCWLVAGMAAVAHARPNVIKDAIAPGNKPGEYIVTLHKFGDNGHYYGPRQITVDRWYPTIERHLVFAQGRYSGGSRYEEEAFQNGGRELWPAILEKAAAQLWGGYDKLGEGAGAGDAFRLITGVGAKEFWLKRGGIAANEKVFEAIGSGLKQGLPLAAGTKTSHKVKGVCANHMYIVVGITDKGVLLRNPHDTAEAVTLDLSTFCRAIDYVTVGGK